MADCSNSKENCQQRKGTIYKITNLLNDKVYVGQTVQELSRRLSQHKNSGKKKGIDRAIKKYGWENFVYETIEECPQEMLDEREIFWIRQFNCMSPKGYNLTPGGDGAYVRTEETKAKLRAANEGKKLSEETRAKISEANKRRAAWNKGKSLSEEHRAKISAANKNLHQKREQKSLQQIRGVKFLKKLAEKFLKAKRVKLFQRKRGLKYPKYIKGTLTGWVKNTQMKLRLKFLRPTKSKE